MKKIFVFMLVLLLMQSCVYVWMRHFNRDDKLYEKDICFYACLAVDAILCLCLDASF